MILWFSCSTTLLVLNDSKPCGTFDEDRPKRAKERKKEKATPSKKNSPDVLDAIQQGDLFLQGPQITAGHLQGQPRPTAGPQTTVQGPTALQPLLPRSNQPAEWH